MNRPPDDMSSAVFLTHLILMFVAFVLALYFLITISRIQLNGINYKPVEYFENYNHCEGEK